MSYPQPRFFSNAKEITQIFEGYPDNMETQSTDKYTFYYNNDEDYYKISFIFTGHKNQQKLQKFLDQKRFVNFFKVGDDTYSQEHLVELFKLMSMNDFSINEDYIYYVSFQLLKDDYYWLHVEYDSILLS